MGTQTLWWKYSFGHGGRISVPPVVEAQLIEKGLSITWGIMQSSNVRLLHDRYGGPDWLASGVPRNRQITGR